MSGNDQDTRPNFFLLGAAKCGTTSVAKYLDQHPEVFVTKPKEPNFFSFEPDSQPTCRGPADSQQLYEMLLKHSVTSPADYSALFSSGQNSLARGEASVRYLYEPHAARRIARYAPQAKLLVLLRDPVDRLYSHYHMNLRQHLEPLTLDEALAAEDERFEQGWGWDWHYRRVGMYARQIQDYLDHFDNSQLQVLFHADLQQKPLETMRKIFEHLGVSANFEPDFSQRAMVGYTPRWQLLRRLIRDQNPIKSIAKALVPTGIRKSFVRWSESKNRQQIPPLSAELRDRLRGQFAADSEQLEELLRRRLPWLTK